MITNEHIEQFIEQAHRYGDAIAETFPGGLVKKH